MQPDHVLFPDLDGSVEATLAEWQADADRAIAEIEPAPSLKECLGSAGTDSSVEATLAEWRADADQAIAEMEPKPSLKEWLSSGGTDTPADAKKCAAIHV